jgi:class 3 adenylate cyclase
MPPADQVYEWSWQLGHPPDRVWPLVSDTQRVNRAMGFTPWRYRTVRDGEGRRRLRGSLQHLGQTIEWDEDPFEWEAPHTFGVNRRYLNGPLASVRSLVTLAPSGGGTRLTHRVTVTPRGMVGSLFARFNLGPGLRRDFDRTYQWIDGHLSGQNPLPYPPRRIVSGPGADDLIRLARAELVKRRLVPAWVDRLIKTLRTASDRDLQRMRPYALARSWGAPPDEVLRLFLHATRAGLLTLTWDVICPLCRGAKERVDDLRRLATEAHCEACEVRIGAHFDKSVEVTFSPTPAVRVLDVADYCSGGPGHTPHVLAQRRLRPGEALSAPEPLPAGAYRVRSEAGTVVDTFTVAEGRPHPGPWTNGGSGELVFLLERTAWADDAATAARVICLQEFRDLFASQVLAQGVRIEVGSVALLFTDLKASTALYERVGDAGAFAVVRDHFQVLFESVAAEGGAVVKTIGDAVMAAFADPAAALRAGIGMQRGIAAHNTAHRPEHPIVLKVGLHFGPCIAVNLDERLDYFGTTVNVAARVQGESEGADIVLPAALEEHRAIRDALARFDGERQPFTRALKGLHGEFELLRLRSAAWGADTARRTG